MATRLNLGIISIPIMQINLVDSRYSKTALHRFSPCCKKAVGNKLYCKGCGEEVLYCDIQKGFDKDMILSKEQKEEVENFLESRTMEVLAIQDIMETTTYNILPYIQKAQLILPCISKGYRKRDIQTYYSFINALKELNKFCVVKYTTKSLEHLGILIHYKDDLLFLEIPFSHYHNKEQIATIKEGLKNEMRIEKIKDLDIFKKEAKKFLKKFEDIEVDISEVKEKKIELLEEFTKNIEGGETEVSIDKFEEEVNPFCEIRK